MDDPFAEQFQLGLDYFNRRDFYESHDAIEEIWLQESSDRQPFLQGLIQAAVAYHHYLHNKWGAARSMLQLSIDKLEEYPDITEGLRLDLLRPQLKSWKAALDEALAGPRPETIALPFPTIERSPSHADD